MKTTKKPFYKRIWLWIVTVIVLSLVVGAFIPYGLQQTSLTEQAINVVQQSFELNVKEPLEDAGVIDNMPVEPEDLNMPEHEQEDCCWAEHSDRIDWEVTPFSPTDDSPVYDELPPDYEALWGVDFGDLETVESFDVWTEEPILNIEGNPKAEEYIYREKSTGKMIVDLTLDGFILKLDPEYKVGWREHTNKAPQSKSKYRKAQNLQLHKYVDGQRCDIDIRPNWNGYEGEPENIDHAEHTLTLAKDLKFHSEDLPSRSLLVELDEPIQVYDKFERYVIELFYGESKVCYDEDLELDILDSMMFLPPELSAKRLSYGEPDRFPEPFYWSDIESQQKDLPLNQELTKKLLEFEDYRFELEPDWIVRKKDDGNFYIDESIRCSVYVEHWKNWQTDFEKYGVSSLNDYKNLEDEEIDENEWGFDDVYSDFEKIPADGYELEKIETTMDLGDTTMVRGQYYIKNEEKRLIVSWDIKNEFDNVPYHSCTPFAEKVLNNFSILK